LDDGAVSATSICAHLFLSRTGPGCASTAAGLFLELGPYGLAHCNTTSFGVCLTKNQWSWNQVANIVFIDQPIGVGFSFLNAGGLLVTTMEQLADQLFAAVNNFASAEFPEFANRPLFIAGESFAGKYVPALSARIQQGNANHESSLNFKGLLIGDGLVDPIAQRTAPKEQALGLGLIDRAQYAQLSLLSQHCQAEILTANYSNANFACRRIYSYLSVVSGGAEQLLFGLSSPIESACFDTQASTPTMLGDLLEAALALELTLLMPSIHLAGTTAPPLTSRCCCAT
jgi:vitellogenic carboxypeptidase-like protein